MPAFINLQQYYVESALGRARAAELDGVDLRLAQQGRRPSSPATITSASRSTRPTVPYDLDADWVIAADGGAIDVAANCSA